MSHRVREDRDDGDRPSPRRPQRFSGGQARPRRHVLVRFTVFRFIARADERASRRTRGRRRLAAVWLPDELETELTRSRRYEHTFALVRIRGGANPNAGPGASIELAEAISSLVRSVDKVWSDAEGVYVLLPEGDRAMTEAMLIRLQQPLAQLLSADEYDAISYVVFPHDGVTRGALLSALDQPVHTRRGQLSLAPTPRSV